MIVNYRKKINGLCFVEDVIDEHGKKVSKIMFDNNCKVIDVANGYISDLRTVSKYGYNTLNRISYDICNLFDFMLFHKIDVNKLEKIHFSLFIEYLQKIDKYENQYAVEKSMMKNLKLNVYEKNKNKNLKKIRNFGCLADISISRIFNNCLKFVNHLIENGVIIDSKLIEIFKAKDSTKRYLRNHGLIINNENIEAVEETKLISRDLIETLKGESSKSNDYFSFLLSLLESSGARIGEILGLKIENIRCTDIKNIKGDIHYDDGKWFMDIVWRIDNPSDSRVKGHQSRRIPILEEYKKEFEIKLERYIRYRNNKLKNKNIDWLLINNLGIKLNYNTANARFKRLLYNCAPEELSEITYHSYRHSYITFALQKGRPLEFVSKYVGHESPKTTLKIYAHLLDKEFLRDYSSYIEGHMNQE